MSIQTIPLSKVVFDPTTQARAVINPETVNTYAELLALGTKLPMPDVFIDDGQYFIGDGWHRLMAHQKNEAAEALVCVHEKGGRKAAITMALCANATHGLPRTNADKRRAVELALTEFPDHSDRRISELCAVGNQLVGHVRKQLCDSHSSPRVGKDGKTRRAPAKATAKDDDAQTSPADDAEVETFLQKHAKRIRRLTGADQEQTPLTRTQDNYLSLKKRDRVAFLVWLRKRGDIV